MAAAVPVLLAGVRMADVVELPSMKWPTLRMFGCSACGQLAVSVGAHWCKGEWRPDFDTVIRYEAKSEAKK